MADLPPPPPSVNPDYVQCPHCGRNYAPNVAERHIPKCVNIQAKPKPPPGLNRTEHNSVWVLEVLVPVDRVTALHPVVALVIMPAYPPPNRSTRGGRY